MSEPLVSAIMPTADRPHFAFTAIEYFLLQTWWNRELVIIDDGVDPLHWSLWPDVVRYYRFPPLSLSIGLKRNIACELARGEYIIHWDDDDRYAEDRMESQMEFLMSKPHKSVTGYRRMIFETPEGRQWRYSGPPHTAVGVSLLYERAHWMANPFECIRTGEDTSFSFKASAMNRLAVVEGDDRIIARIHAGNTSGKSDAELEKHPENWERL